MISVQLNNLEQKVFELSDLISAEKALYQQKLSLLSAKQAESLKTQEELDLYKKTSDFLSSFSSDMRNAISSKIEGLVTNVLHNIWPNKYSFRILFQQKRGLPEAIFCLYNNFKKKEIDILEASCGTVGDIVSIVLHFVFLQIVSPSRGFLIFDETGKFISADLRIQFFRFLKDLALSNNKQIIFVSHQDELLNVADRIMRFELDENGYTKVLVIA